VAVIQAAAKEEAFSSTVPSMLELLKRLQSGDAYSKKTIKACRMSTGNKQPLKRWRVDGDDLLRLGEAIYVPGDAAVKQELMKIHHDDPFGGHQGVKRTQDLLRRKYYWDRMNTDVKEYVGTCEICQKTHSRRHKMYGQLASLPIPRRPMTDLSMDFITGLPPTIRRGIVYDAILVIVDRYTKLAIYIPTQSDIDAEGLADLFTEDVLRRFGRPESMVSDRGSLFTSGFWTALCGHFRIKRRLSTAFHPQTDGQTERMNQILEQYLRAYANYRQDDWIFHLPVAEFTYNNSKQSSTGMSPFYALYGYHPQPLQDDDWSCDLPNIAAEERVRTLDDIRRSLEENLQKAVDSQAKYYDRKHKSITFAVGDKVLLSTKNLKTWRPSKKLDNKYEGPFSIVEAVGKQAYRLKLPKSFGKTHPTFHVSLLEPYRQRPGEAPAEMQPIVIEGEEEWEVEDILGERMIGKRKQYMVKWKDFPVYENSWVDEQDLHAPEIQEQYMTKKKAERKPRTSSKRRKRKA